MKSHKLDLLNTLSPFLFPYEKSLFCTTAAYVAGSKGDTPHFASIQTRIHRTTSQIRSYGHLAVQKFCRSLIYVQSKILLALCTFYVKRHQSTTSQIRSYGHLAVQTFCRSLMYVDSRILLALCTFYVKQQRSDPIKKSLTP